MKELHLTLQQDELIMTFYICLQSLLPFFNLISYRPSVKRRCPQPWVMFEHVALWVISSGHGGNINVQVLGIIQHNETNEKQRIVQCFVASTRTLL